MCKCRSDYKFDFKMTLISLSEEIRVLVPDLTLSCIECDVSVSEDNEALWLETEQKTSEIASGLKIEDISLLPAISASRKAYRACGKDPARYRLSAEALLRRVVSGKGLYRVNNVVDLLNLVSISTGFSIGGYDADKILGDVVFGVGKENELYEGIGRGALNIASLPVFRDEIGAFGTPTSDSVRTSVISETVRFLMIIIGFGNLSELDGATALAVTLLEKYAFAKNIEIKKIS